MLIGLAAGLMLLLVGVGAVWGVTAAAASGRLGRNMWAGIRLGSTGASDEAWLAGHQAALPISRAIAGISIVTGLAMILDGITSNNEDGSAFFWTLFVIGYGSVLLGSVVVGVRASRAARATTTPS